MAGGEDPHAVPAAPVMLSRKSVTGGGGTNGFHLAIAHHGITALEVTSVNWNVDSSKVARNGGLYWFEGVTQTVAPSAGNVFGRGVQTRGTGYFFFGFGLLGGFCSTGPVGIGRVVWPSRLRSNLICRQPAQLQVW